MNRPLVLLVGNLGAGKTTLAKCLGEHFGWWVGIESVSDNPYLDDFYAEMARWSFNLQIYFLNNRIRLHEQASGQSSGAVLDRSIYEDRYIFAESLFDQGLLSPRDFQTYKELFDFVARGLRSPDLVLYLTAPIPTLHERIQERGQTFERTLSFEYLARIEARYRDWISTLPAARLLVVDSTSVDFTRSPCCCPVLQALLSDIADALRCTA